MQLKYFLITLGCQKNEYDSQVIAGIVSSCGYILSENIEEADLIILNTCCIRNKADVKVYGRLGRYADLKKQNPSLIIAVTGCLAQKDGKKLLSRFRHLDLVIGTRNIRMLPQLFDMVKKTGKRRYVCDMNEMQFEDLPIERGELPFAWIPISEGCNCRCTYCIVPFVRGELVSRNPQNIIQEIKQFAESGGVEITLLGQNVNAYGKDNPSFGTFGALLEKINALEGLRRIRFTSPHPANFDEEFIKTMAHLDKVCEHVHLPLQAGDDTILRRMGRNYTTDDFRKIMRLLREHIPNISVTTDIIVGFPGENDAQFENTLNFVEEMEFNGAFMFAYSEREGTAAVKLPEPVLPQVRGNRLNTLIARQNAITLRKHQQLEGMTEEVFVERLSKKDEEFLTGKTRRNTVVNFRGDRKLVGSFVKVCLKKGFTWGLMGEKTDGKEN